MDSSSFGAGHWRAGAAGVSLALASAIAFGQATSGDPAKAKVLASTNCVACHGADGNSSEPRYPKLAGLQPEYIYKQLNDFKAGKRQSEIMAPIVAVLSPDDFANLAAFFSAQKAAPGTVKDPKLAEQGKKIYHEGKPDVGVPSCSGCHYDKGEGTSRFPRIAGQHAEYTYQQLKAFKEAKRENDRGLAMQSVALNMSDADMRAVAEYVAGL
ncbi:MAG TPA: c-type cytochrome [Burkholderiales bacterium]|nr:c-type cytochrome [Burkholderiales bacterium]